MVNVEETQPKKRSRTEGHTFPGVDVTLSKESFTNIAPIVFNLTSRKNPEDVINAVRIACKYGGIEKVTADLGLRDEKEFPLKVQSYKSSFYGIPQILPVAVVEERFSDGQVIKAIGTIPLNPISIDDWTFGFKQRFADDGGGGRIRVFQNFMEKREENSATFMRAWMDPYISKGIEFKPEKWFGFFEYSSAKLGDKGFVDFYDHAEISATFSVYDKGLYFCEDFKAKLQREFIHGHKTLEFTLGGPRGMEQDSNPDWPKLVSGGKKFRYPSDAITRMAKKGSWAPRENMSHNDLVVASIFPNMSGDTYGVNYSESLHCLLEKFKKGNPDELSGYDWIKFE